MICIYKVFKKVNQIVDEGRALQTIAQMKQGRVIELNEDGSYRDLGEKSYLAFMQIARFGFCPMKVCYCIYLYSVIAGGDSDEAIS